MLRTALVLTILTLTALAQGAGAQMPTGPFVGRSGWTSGVGVNGGTGVLSIDADFSGQLENYAAPAVLGDLGTLQVAASPSRQFLYARQTAPATGCGVGQHQIFYYRFDPTGPTLLPVMQGQICLDPSVPAHDGLFERPGADQRVAWIAELVQGAATQQTLYLINLNGSDDWASVQMTRDIESFLTFAPGGEAALVRHATGSLGDGDGTRADHAVIDLCPSPRLGTVISGDPLTAGALAGLLQPPASASIAEPTTGSFVVRVAHPDLNASGELDFAISPCSGVTPPPPPPLETLSVTVVGPGSVSSNPAGIQCSDTEFDCDESYPVDTAVTLSASWGFGVVFAGWGGDCVASGTLTQAPVTLDVDRSCTATFGAYDLDVEVQAPASVPRGGQIDYVVAYENTGTLPVTGVVLRAFVPGSTTFVSAGQGGSHDNGQLDWTIGALDPGQTGQVTYSVSTQTASGCNAFQLFNHNASIDSDQTSQENAASVSTQLDAVSTAPITVSVVSTPPGPVLRGGDVVTHEVTLTNTVAEPRACVKVGPLAGQASTWNSVIDAAGGTVETTAPALWQWVGDLGPSQTRTIVWSTRVNDCFDEAVTETRLNDSFGSVFVNVGTSIVGFGPTQAFPLAQTATSSIRVEEAGALQTLPDGGGIQAVRSPADVTLELQVVNLFDAPEPGVSASFSFPPGLTPLGSPPFAGTPPAGTSWDAATSSVSWSGDLDPLETVTIRLAAQLAGGACSQTLDLGAATATCDIGSSVELIDVQLPPAGDHLVALGRYSGLYTWEPGVDSGFEPLMCLPVTEGYGAMAADPGAGEYWVIGQNSGVPSFRLRLAPLELEVLDAATAGAIGVSEFVGPLAAAVDPTDGSIVIATDSFGSSGLLRLDPVTRGVSFLGFGLPRITGLAVEDDGTILANAGDGGLLVIDPASPASFVTLTDAAWDHMGQGVAIAPDGRRWIAPLDTLSSIQDLVSVDPLTDAFAIEALDLGGSAGLALGTPPFGTFFAGLAAAPDGTLYAATNQQLGLLERPAGGAVSFTPSAPLGTPPMAVLEDLAFVPGSSADRDGDGVPDAGDVCPDVADAGQQDTDGNGRGDACECGDQNGDGSLNVGDILAINAAIFDTSLVTPLCDANEDGACNVGDILAVNAAIFGAPTWCAAYPAP